MALGALGDVEVGKKVRGRRIRLDRLGKAEVERLVDEAPARDVVPVNKGDSSTGLARAAGATNAVKVRLLVLGALVIHHVRHVVDIDTASGDVGGNKHVNLARTECAEGLLTGALAQIAVNGAGGEAALTELIGDLGGGALGASKDNREAAALRLKNARKHLDLVKSVRPIDKLLRGLDRGAAVVGVRCTNVRGLRHVATGKCDHRSGHRR